MKHERDELLYNYMGQDCSCVHIQVNDEDIANYGTLLKCYQLPELNIHVPVDDNIYTWNIPQTIKIEEEKKHKKLIKPSIGIIIVILLFFAIIVLLIHFLL